MSSAATKIRFTPQEYPALERKSETRNEYYNGEIFAMAGMVQNACHSGDSSGPLDGSGVLQRLLPAAERRNFIAWRREPQGRCRRERTTNPLDPNPKRGRQLNASRTWGRL